MCILWEFIGESSEDRYLRGEWREVLDCDAVATRTTSTFMGSPGAGMVLENLPALKQGYP